MHDVKVPERSRVRRTDSQGGYDCSNVLLSVQSKGHSVELKSLSLNPARPSQLAVAAGDCFVRVYDRRMMSLRGPAAAAAAPPRPTLMLAPPHLSLGATTNNRISGSLVF